MGTELQESKEVLSAQLSVVGKQDLVSTARSAIKYARQRMIMQEDSIPACKLVQHSYAAWCTSFMHASLVSCHAVQHAHHERLGVQVSGRSST